MQRRSAPPSPALSPLGKAARTTLVLGAWLLAAHAHAAGPAAPKAFPSLSEGLKETKAGAGFLVGQNGGNGAYRYLRTESGAVFQGMELFGPNAEKYAAERSAEQKVPPPASGLMAHLWGTNAREWDGRVIPNEVAAVPPTLNLLPDPFNPANESGSNEPARTLNTSDTKDPLGGSNALRLAFTGPNQQLYFASGAGEGVYGPWSAPLDLPLRLRVWAKLLSGAKNYTLGLYTTRTDLTGEWAEYQQDVTLKNPAGLGFGSGPGNSDGVAAIAGAAIYDEYAGEKLPGLAELLADQKGAHGTLPLRLPGMIPLTEHAAIDNRKLGAGIRIFTGPDLLESPEYTLGVWVSPEQIRDPSYGTAITIGDHLDGTAKYNLGMLGIYSDKNSAIERRGRLRPFPTNNVGSKQTGQYLLEQGWQHLALTVKNGVTTPYINGIPIYEATQPTWKAPRFNAFSVGYYMPNLRRQASNRYLPCQWQGAYLARKAMTDEEILQMDRHGRARLPVTGITPAKRHAVAFGMGAGSVAKPQSWWWHLCENYGLNPRLHGHLEARTAGGLADWENPERLAFFTRQVLAAADSYDEVWCFVPSGEGDERIWAAAGFKIDGYRAQYQDYLKKLRAIHPKVRIAAATALPRAQAGDPPKFEQSRQAWNEALRRDFAAMGIDRLFDIGLGTERISADGTVSAESLPGGTPMGNWRTARASLAHKRNPASPLELSATEGNAIEATAGPGTFGPEAPKFFARNT
ncbi:MAG TPA: hypothetical protein PLS03_11975 [Terrimicrobiaceae bacterium]|nr:hypothetical protein [Terrimicrobiaceae bacterium]